MEEHSARSANLNCGQFSPEDQSKQKFLDAWDQRRDGLEQIKGQIMDENHVTFAQDNNIYFWTTKGLGIISIVNLIHKSSPYKLFLSSGIM